VENVSGEVGEDEMTRVTIPDHPKHARAAGVVICLFASAVMLGAAPKLLPADYDWIAHTTSEAAAQRVNGAWMARSGFLFFGLAVIWLAAGARKAGALGRGPFMARSAFSCSQPR
jgi:hypothetical protein